MNGPTILLKKIIYHKIYLYKYFLMFDSLYLHVQ